MNEDVRKFIDDYCILRVPKGSTALLAKGAPVDTTNPAHFMRWMFMIKPALFDPRVMAVINNHFFDTYPDIAKGKYQIAGMEHASTAIVTSLLLEAYRRGVDLHGFSIRELKKTFGTRTWFEGTPDLKRKTILVDDISSYRRTTFTKGKIILNEAGLTVQDAYCIINLGIKDEFVHNTTLIKISSMFKKDDFTLELPDDELLKELYIPNNAGIKSFSMADLDAEQYDPTE